MDRILDIFLISPLIIAAILAFCIFIKKNSTINLIVKIFAVLNFIFSSYFLINSFSYFQTNNLNYLNNSFIFLFLYSAIFLLFVLFSKDFILKLNKMFSTVLILLCGLINLFILSESVFLNLAIIFWFLLIYFLLTYSFGENKEQKRNFKLQLLGDIILFFICVFLISFEFIRYFIVNSIVLNFSNINNALVYISDSACLCALFGFLVIAFRLFNFPIFSFGAIKNLKHLNNFIASFLFMTSTFLGFVVFYKALEGFFDLFLSVDNILILYFIFNFIYICALTLKETNLIRFCAIHLSAVLNIALLVFIIFDKNSQKISLYYFITAILSYLCALFVSIFLENKMKTRDINNFKKIRNENRVAKSLVLYSFLNILNIPFLGLFAPFVLSICAIFVREYSLPFMNYIVYILPVGLFMLVLGGVNVINKILIEPEVTISKEFEFSKIQKTVFVLLVLFIVMFGFCGSFALNAL